MRRDNRKVWVWVFGLIVLLMLVLLVRWVLVIRESNLVWRTSNGVLNIAEAMIGEVIWNRSPRDKPLSLPRGDIRDLYRWLMARERFQDPKRQEIPLTDRREQTFSDVWGNELVYRFPARCKMELFDLYSKGPNGVDDGGAGDDITCRPMAEIRRYACFFKDERVDLDWIRANLDRLENYPGTMKIIGVSPDELGFPGTESVQP